ncbi:MFS transporter [Porphyromonadaceae bacterium W3.11]|nr:MFS transporter [Porphyromonadaceae bacterium W3.11]
MKSKFWNNNFIKVVSANLLLALPFYILIVVLPLYIKDGLGVPEKQIGIILSMYSFAAVLMRPITGYLLDNFNRKVIYLLGFALYTICIVLYPLVGSALMVGILRFAHGLGWGGVSSSGSTLAIDFVPKHRRGEGIGIFGMSMTVATMIGPMLGSAIYRWTGDFPTVFIISFFLSAMAFAIGCSLRIPKTPQKRSPLELKNFFSKKAFPASLLALWSHMPYGFVLGFIALYAATLDGADSGLFFLIYAMMAFVGRYAAGRIFDVRGPRLLMLIGTILTALGFIALAQFSSKMGLYVGAIPIGLGFGTMMNVTQSMANHGVPISERGRANSTYLMLFDVGIGLGIFLFGQIIGQFGYQTSIYVSVSIVLSSLLVFFLYALPAYYKHPNVSRVI